MDPENDVTATCAYLAALYGDRLTGTATEATGYVLLEHEGPWGKNTLTESGLHPSEVAVVKRLMRETGIMVQLISPPPGRAPAHAYLAGDPADGRPAWLASAAVRGFGDLQHLDFAALAAGERSAGTEPVAGPLYVICANEQSDPCCGRTGYRLFAAAEEVAGGRARRTSHVGGHKFAPNLIAFPYALFFGRVDPMLAPDLIDAFERGDIYLDKYRGRAAYSLPTQAAEHFLRRELSNVRITDVQLRWEATTGDVHRAVFAVNGAEHEVAVRADTLQPPRLQSCSDAEGRAPISWKLVAISRPSVVARSAR
jgi:hypothetical protein